MHANGVVLCENVVILYIMHLGILHIHCFRLKAAYYHIEAAWIYSTSQGPLIVTGKQSISSEGRGCGMVSSLHYLGYDNCPLGKR